MKGDSPQLSSPQRRVFLSILPQPLSNHLKRGVSLMKGLFLAKAPCSTRRVGLTAQTLEGALIPLVRLVSAPCHLNILDGGRNDVVGFRPFGAIRCSITSEFYPEHLLGNHPSASLVADPSRRKIVRTTIPSFLLLKCRVAEVIIQLARGVSTLESSGRIGAWNHLQQLAHLLMSFLCFVGFGTKLWRGTWK